MSETFWEKWQHRIRDAWSVLTGRAYAKPYWLEDYEWTPFDRCPGCDGHECDEECAYPGAVKGQR